MKKTTDEKERQVKKYGKNSVVQLFLSVGSNIILDFLSDWNDRKHNSKFVALCQKTSLYKRYDLYEDASLACFDQFLCPGDFSVLAAKRRQTCISI